MNTSQQFPTKYDKIYVMLLDLDSSPHRLTSITNVTDYSTIKKIVDGFFDWFFGRLYCALLILYNQPFSISVDEFLSMHDRHCLLGSAYLKIDVTVSPLIP